MGDIKCSLQDQCYVINEGKKHKKLTRLFACRNCRKSFHAYCGGWHEKSETQFNTEKETFVCDSCNTFFDAVSDLVAQKIKTAFNSFRAEIKQLLVSNTSSENIAKIDNSIDKSIKEVQSGLSHDLENSNNEILESLVSSENNNCITDENDKCTQQANKSKNENLFKNVQPDKISNTQYLCSIENELSLADIDLILTDANIKLDNIQISNVSGDFKRKKYVEISSNSAISMFKFKRLFNASNLNGTWFLRQTPPKHKKPTISKNSSTYHTVSNEHMAATDCINVPSRTSEKPKVVNNNFRTQNAPYKNHNHNSYIQRNYTTNRYQNKDRSSHQQNRSYASAVKGNYGNNNNPSNISTNDFQNFLETVIYSLLKR